MNTTFLIDGRVVFHSRQNALVSLAHPDLVEILNEPCARCLEMLLAAHGNIVTHAELYKGGWGEAYKDVSPNTLYQNILLARKALRKVAETHDDFIITVPRQGFRFNENLTVMAGDTSDNTASVPHEHQSETHNGGGDNILFRRTISPPLFRAVTLAPLLLILFSAMIFIFTDFHYGTARHDDFTADYDFSRKYAGCEIYLNKRQTLSRAESEKLLNTFPGLTSGCSGSPLRYMSFYHNTLRVFYLSCDSKNKADRICSSGYLRLSE
ncbi:DNA-binding winged helix-turn-helix (wHTH) protein [Lelliottia sp. 489]|uniref:winged helix-turn-helix domain-containing protein n=1 Tax=Lelliottia sp. 489 TaxID=3156448 RepID=UPI003D216403